MAQLKELIWTREMVTRFWNFERTRPENFFSFQVGAVVARKFRKYFLSDADIVDYGAGTGFLVEDLLASGIRCGAVEFGNDAVAELNGQFRDHPLFLGAQSFEALDAWREKFDGVFLVEVIEHLYDNELSTALVCIRDLLKPGGVLIVTTPNEEDRSKNFICSPESGLLFHHFQHVRSWSAASLRAALESHGYSCIETGTADFTASTLALRRTTPLPKRILRSIAKHFMPRRPHLYAVVKRI
jgi:2-polyprenyl-3-methyl-5-hydroxy-6-metoxy-1,4-benzoquinol methylase